MKVLVAEAASNAAKLKGSKAERVLAKAEGRVYEQPRFEEERATAADEDERMETLEELAKEIWRNHPHAKGDKDAKIGKTSVKESFCGYLSTAVVDEKRGIVLSYETVPGNVDQGKTFGAAYEGAVEVAGKPEKLVADRAFDLLEIRERLEQAGVEAYIPMIKTHRKGDVLGSEHFKVIEVEGGYEVKCPAGHRMRQRIARENGLLVFRGTMCEGCPLQAKCTTANDGVRNFEFGPRLRKFQEAQWALRETEEYKQAMKMRMATIEPVFGHGKTFHNLGKSIYRSLGMQRIQTAMSFFAVNLEKLVKYAPQPA